ncbi:MAG TPA: hypothetical protein VK479_01420 [Micropepsaceae bacterium]|nr:hypothetical protein [Micropepsaceae bacterium]
MRSPRLLAMAAILFSSVAVPASAAWDRIGSVDFSRRDNTDTQYGNFGGRVESLSLVARNADVRCRDVTATFNNGNSQQIFRGSLPRGRNVEVTLPNGRMIRRLDFNCRVMDRDRATVDIAADVGRYQAEWRQSPDWDRTWSRMFPWANDRNGNDRYGNNDRFGNDRYVTGRLDTSGWITLGSEQFNGRNDHEMTFGGWRARDVSSIALRPLNDDARCTDVKATFANGETRDLNIDGRNILRRDRVTTLDLPGDRRNVQRIDMTCHAEHGGMVTMQVLASR